MAVKCGSRCSRRKYLFSKPLLSSFFKYFSQISFKTPFFIFLKFSKTLFLLSFSNSFTNWLAEDWLDAIKCQKVVRSLISSDDVWPCRHKWKGHFCQKEEDFFQAFSSLGHWGYTKWVEIFALFGDGLSKMALPVPKKINWDQLQTVEFQKYYFSFVF